MIVEKVLEEKVMKCMLQAQDLDIQIEEYLSDNVYYYNHVNNKIEIVA